jgi:hypothetical protein
MPFVEVLQALVDARLQLIADLALGERLRPSRNWA